MVNEIKICVFLFFTSSKTATKNSSKNAGWLVLLYQTSSGQVVLRLMLSTQPGHGKIRVKPVLLRKLFVSLCTAFASTKTVCYRPLLSLYISSCKPLFLVLSQFNPGVPINISNILDFCLNHFYILKSLCFYNNCEWAIWYNPFCWRQTYHGRIGRFYWKSNAKTPIYPYTKS